MNKRIESWKKSHWKLKSKDLREERIILIAEDTLFVGAAFGDDIRSTVAEDKIEVDNSHTKY